MGVLWYTELRNRSLYFSHLRNIILEAFSLFVLFCNELCNSSQLYFCDVHTALHPGAEIHVCCACTDFNCGNT